MKKENVQIGFALQGIKTEQFAILEENYNPKKEIDLGTEVEFKLDYKAGQMGVFVGFEFSHGKKLFLKIQVSCHFGIEESCWNDFVKNDIGKVVIPKGFLAHLAMITIGTARGVLFAKTESTPFSKYIVPTVNVSGLIAEDISFSVEGLK